MTILVIGGSGYIGSAVAKHLNADTVDIQWFGGPTPKYNVDYRDLSKEFFADYSHVVLLAAHSSMAMCADNWSSAWQNNVTNFSQLLGKLETNQTLIYASSGSVYGSSGINRVEHEELGPANIEYDLTKQIGEKLAVGARCKTIGLRLGTLSGFNSHARSDLMLNAMTISAINNRKVTVYNGANHRGILGLRDCVRAIETMIIKQPQAQHSIFNLTSYNGSVLNFAESVATILNVELDIKTEVTNNFSFELDTNMFKNVYGFQFKENAETIINSLVENYADISWTTRVRKIHYV
jgi:nucleoside-diphosphate-sugar epimerase